MFFWGEESMKTLYVTDLDGTLLEPDKSIEPENLKLKTYKSTHR